MINTFLKGGFQPKTLILHYTFESGYTKYNILKDSILNYNISNTIETLVNSCELEIPISFLNSTLLTNLDVPLDTINFKKEENIVEIFPRNLITYFQTLDYLNRGKTPELKEISFNIYDKLVIYVDYGTSPNETLNNVNPSTGVITPTTYISYGTPLYVGYIKNITIDTTWKLKLHDISLLLRTIPLPIGVQNLKEEEDDYIFYIQSNIKRWIEKNKTSKFWGEIKHIDIYSNTNKNNDNNNSGGIGKLKIITNVLGQLTLNGATNLLEFLQILIDNYPELDFYCNTRILDPSIQKYYILFGLNINLFGVEKADSILTSFIKDVYSKSLTINGNLQYIFPLDRQVNILPDGWNVEIKLVDFYPYGVQINLVSCDTSKDKIEYSLVYYYDYDGTFKPTLLLNSNNIFTNSITKVLNITKVNDIILTSKSFPGVDILIPQPLPGTSDLDPSVSFNRKYLLKPENSGDSNSIYNRAKALVDQQTYTGLRGSIKFLPTYFPCLGIPVAVVDGKYNQKYNDSGVQEGYQKYELKNNTSKFTYNGIYYIKSINYVGGEGGNYCEVLLSAKLNWLNPTFIEKEKTNNIMTMFGPFDVINK